MTGLSAHPKASLADVLRDRLAGLADQPYRALCADHA